MPPLKAEETKSLSRELHEFSRIGFKNSRSFAKFAAEKGLKKLVP